MLLAAIVETPSALHRVRPRAGAGLTVTAAMLFTAGGVLGALALAFAAVLTLAAALAAAAGALWLLRATPDRSDGDDSGGRGPDGGPVDSGPTGDIDWDAFEADFAAYTQRHVLVRVP